MNVFGSQSNYQNNRKYILLCNYFALSRIESIFAIEAPWYDRHQSRTSLLC